MALLSRRRYQNERDLAFLQCKRREGITILWGGISHIRNESLRHFQVVTDNFLSLHIRRRCVRVCADVSLFSRKKTRVSLCRLRRLASFSLSRVRARDRGYRFQRGQNYRPIPFGPVLHVEYLTIQRPGWVGGQRSSMRNLLKKITFPPSFEDVNF